MYLDDVPTGSTGTQDLLTGGTKFNTNDNKCVECHDFLGLGRITFLELEQAGQWWDFGAEVRIDQAEISIIFYGSKKLQPN